MIWWWLLIPAFALGAVCGMAFTGSRWMRTYNELARKYRSETNNPYGDSSEIERRADAWDEGYAFAYEPDSEADSRPSWNPYRDRNS